MRTDYKFWYIMRDDYGCIVKCTIRFFEGDYQNIKIRNPITERLRSVSKYIRTKRLTKKDLSYLGKGFEKELSGEDCKIYTTNDFGEIKTDDELRAFLNAELSKDETREAIDVQKETDIATLNSMEIK